MQYGLTVTLLSWLYPAKEELAGTQAREETGQQSDTAKAPQHLSLTRHALPLPGSGRACLVLSWERNLASLVKESTIRVTETLWASVG